MCFLAIFMLKKMIDIHIFAKLLQELGYSIEIRNNVVEAWKNRARLRATLEYNRIRVETNDYGPECARDYEALIKGLIELDTKPEVIYFSSPYVYGFEKKRGRTKKLLEELGLEAEEIYSGRCG